LVGGDPLTALGVDGVQVEQAVRLFRQRLATHLAAVGAVAHVVVVAAAGASAGGGGDDVAPGVRRQLNAFDLVAGALVVDERTRPELADGQEAGALEVVAVAGPAA